MSRLDIGEKYWLPLPSWEVRVRQSMNPPAGLSRNLKILPNAAKLR